MCQNELDPSKWRLMICVRPCPFAVARTSRSSGPEAAAAKDHLAKAEQAGVLEKSGDSRGTGLKMLQLEHLAYGLVGWLVKVSKFSGRVRAWQVQLYSA